jgi:putative MATE family efflux protein
MAPVAVPTASPVLAERTRRLLEGPIAPTLLRLAAPNVAVMTVQAALSVLDAYYVSALGPDALAGISLVFPLVMLMQTMSGGGMGGGVASAIARALGGGRRGEANALAVHALLIATFMAALFTAGALALGPALYRALGGTDGALAQALAYSNVLFAGAIAVWALNTLASIVRGTGAMTVPAVVVVGGALVHIVLSPALITGWGPFPRLGVAGAAVAMVVNASFGSLALAGYLLSGRSLVRVSRAGLRPRVALFWEILRVGAPGSLNTVFTNATVVILTGLVGRFGTFALAGYGMGARLEYLLIPLVFGFGSALVAMVGTSVGAGHRARAERVAWVGAGLAAAVTGTIGLAAALAPGAWMGLFSREPDVVAAGTTYLRIVGPAYPFFGAGLALYFASQGAGRLTWPLVAGGARLLVAGVGGLVVVNTLGLGLPAVCAVIALALVVFGTLVVTAVYLGAWRPASPGRGRAVSPRPV